MLKKTLAVFFLVAVLGAAWPAQAALLPNCNPIPGNANSCGVGHIIQLLVNIYNFLLGLAAFVAILAIIGAGVGMLVYHWFENAEQILEGSKLTLTRAVTGFIIIAAAYLIVNTLILLLTGSATGFADIMKKLIP